MTDDMPPEQVQSKKLTSDIEAFSEMAGQIMKRTYRFAMNSTTKGLWTQYDSIMLAAWPSENLTTEEKERFLKGLEEAFFFMLKQLKDDDIGHMSKEY